MHHAVFTDIESLVSKMYLHGQGEDKQNSTRLIVDFWQTSVTILTKIQFWLILFLMRINHSCCIFFLPNNIKSIHFGFLTVLGPGSWTTFLHVDMSADEERLCLVFKKTILLSTLHSQYVLFFQQSVNWQHRQKVLKFLFFKLRPRDTFWLFFFKINWGFF